MPFVVLTGTPSKPLPATTLSGSSGRGTGGSFPKVLNQDNSEEVYYQTIGENVVRFEISLLRKPNFSNPAKPIAARLLSDTETPIELAQYGFSNISALIITIAVVDAQSSLRVSTASINALDLPDTVPTDFPLYPLDQWNKTFSGKLNTLPKTLSGGLRFYQRAIQL
jgi:hypothetical protein